MGWGGAFAAALKPRPGWMESGEGDLYMPDGTVIPRGHTTYKQPVTITAPSITPVVVGGLNLNTKLKFTAAGRAKHGALDEVYNISSKRTRNGQTVYTVHLAQYPNSTMYWHYDVNRDDFYTVIG